jgi:hypothetical protein
MSIYMNLQKVIILYFKYILFTVILAVAFIYIISKYTGLYQDEDGHNYGDVYIILGVPLMLFVNVLLFILIQKQCYIVILLCSGLFFVLNNLLNGLESVVMTLPNTITSFLLYYLLIKKSDKTNKQAWYFFLLQEVLYIVLWFGCWFACIFSIPYNFYHDISMYEYILSIMFVLIGIVHLILLAIKFRNIITHKAIQKAMDDGRIVPFPRTNPEFTKQ